MAQFSNVTYGSRFPTSGLRATNTSGPIPMGSTPYGGYAGAGGGLAALLAGGLQANDWQGVLQNPGYNTGVAPSNQVKSAQAAPSSFDPSQGAQLPSFAGGPQMSDLATDPILQQIQAAGQRAVQDSRNAALASAENAIIGYGGIQGTDALRGQYAAQADNPILAALTDAATQQAAAANPDSTLMRLANTNTQNQAHLNQGLNANNLFYSSERGNDLGQLANSYRSAQNDASASLAGLLGNANQGVLNAEGQAQDNYLNALQGAWDRWMSMHPPGAGAAAPASAPPTQGQPTNPYVGGNAVAGTTGAGGFVPSQWGIFGSNGPQTISGSPLAAALAPYLARSY